MKCRANKVNFVITTAISDLVFKASVLFSGQIEKYQFFTDAACRRCCCSSSPAGVSYLEKGAVALQPGGAQRGDGAQTAPEMDARQQGTVGQQQTAGSLWQVGVSGRNKHV